VRGTELVVVVVVAVVVWTSGIGMKNSGNVSRHGVRSSILPTPTIVAAASSGWQRSGQLEVAEHLEAWQLHRAGGDDVIERASWPLIVLVIVTNTICSI
jgi:hypothetical protein